MKPSYSGNIDCAQNRLSTTALVASKLHLKASLKAAVSVCSSFNPSLGGAYRELENNMKIINLIEALGFSPIT